MTTNTLRIDAKVIKTDELYAAAKTFNHGVLNDKAVVNYIRHKLTPYDAMMDKTRTEKHGYAKRAAIRRAALQAIIDDYWRLPNVVAEAKRQLAETKAEAERRVVYSVTPGAIAAYFKAQEARTVAA